MRFALRFSLRDLLWLTTVVALGTGWLFNHRAARESTEALRSQLSQAQQNAEFFLESSRRNSCDAEALRAVLSYERIGLHASDNVPLVWSRTAGPFIFEVEIPFTDEKEQIGWWMPRDVKRVEEETQMSLKPAINCLGATVVHARGHIAESTGLMNILKSPPTGWVPPAANVVHIPGLDARVKLTLPEQMRSGLESNGLEQHHIAIYGGWRESPDTLSAKSAKLDTKWNFFLVRPLVIVP